jgi:hypothetical protein
MTPKIHMNQSAESSFNSRVKSCYYLVFKERIVKVDIKAVSKRYIGWFPLDRICHIQCLTSINKLWTFLSKINMDNLHESSSADKWWSKFEGSVKGNGETQTWLPLYLMKIVLWVKTKYLLSLFLSASPTKPEKYNFFKKKISLLKVLQRAYQQ